MAAYTNVSKAELRPFLARYGAGEILRWAPAENGVDNTNYFVDTSRGRFVLTLYESLTEEEIPPFFRLLDFLSKHHVPCPRPLADTDGRRLGRIGGRPAALFPRLPGRSIADPAPLHCEEVGVALAQLHIAGTDLLPWRQNPKGLPWWQRAASALATRLTAAQRTLLAEELSFQSARRPVLQALPRGIIHADLFRDNALFQGDRLTGLVDFYSACDESLFYDVAVVANDWCSDAEGRLDQWRVESLLQGYASVRMPQRNELAAWPDLLRAAALRFWLSRLVAKQRRGVAIKDPDRYRIILEYRRRTRYATISLQRATGRSSTPPAPDSRRRTG